MSAAEVARLERAIEATRSVAEAILRRLDAQGEPKRAGLTIVAFAKASGLSRTTVCRRLADKSLYRVKGRIPYELLKPFLS